MTSSIRRNQKFRLKKNPNFQVVVTHRKGGKWRAKVLSRKPGVYRGSHSLSTLTLRTQYEIAD